MEQDLSSLYGKIAGPWIATLLGELLVLGFFFVLYNYIRLVINNPGAFNKTDIFKRLALLGGVSVFVFYVDLTYFITYEKIPFDKLLDTFKDLSSLELARSKITLLALVPIDLLTVGILTGMFASLSFEAFVDNKSERKQDYGLSNIVLKLFLFTFGFHFVTLIWWLVYAALASATIPLGDMLYHTGYSTAHIISYFAWRKYFLKNDNNTFAIINYLVLVVSVYVTRIWWYIDKLLD